MFGDKDNDEALDPEDTKEQESTAHQSKTEEKATQQKAKVSKVELESRAVVRDNKESELIEAESTYTFFKKKNELEYEKLTKKREILLMILNRGQFLGRADTLLELKKTEQLMQNCIVKDNARHQDYLSNKRALDLVNSRAAAEGREVSAIEKQGLFFGKNSRNFTTHYQAFVQKHKEPLTILGTGALAVGAVTSLPATVVGLAAYGISSTKPVEKMLHRGFSSGLEYIGVDRQSASDISRVASEGTKFSMSAGIASIGNRLANGLLPRYASAVSESVVGLYQGSSLGKTRGYGVGKTAVNTVKTSELSAWQTFKQSGGRQELTLREHAQAEKIAQRVYDEIRISTVDTKKIASNTGMHEFKIRRIKEHIFIKEHKLLHGEIGRFDPDPLIAESWKRLEAGTFTKKDIQLLNHELFESKFEGIFKSDYISSHSAANRAGYASPIESLSTVQLAEIYSGFINRHS